MEDMVKLKGTQEEIIVDLLRNFPELAKLILASQDTRDQFMMGFLLHANVHGSNIKTKKENYTDNINREKFNIPKTNYFINISKTTFDLFQDAAIITVVLAVFGMATADVSKIALLLAVFAKTIRHAARASDVEKCMYDAIITLQKSLKKEAISIEDLIPYYENAKAGCAKVECSFNNDEKCAIGPDIVEKLLEGLERKEIIQKNGLYGWEVAL